MPRWVLAAKRGHKSAGRPADVAKSFPGVTVLGSHDGHVVTVEAEPDAMQAFEAAHGADFLIEQSVERKPGGS